MPNVATGVTAGASIFGGMMQGDAAEDAAATQAGAANNATAAQLQMFNIAREDQRPWRETGQKGLTQLSQLLGIGKKPTSGTFDARALIEKVRPYNATTIPMDDYAAGFTGDYQSLVERLRPFYKGPGSIDEFTSEFMPLSPDELAAAQKGYGTLLKDFTRGDFETDPGYQFRLEEGEKAINRAAAAAGRYDSPRTIKELLTYNSGIASDEYGRAFDRFNVGGTNKFNRLAMLAGIGQTAANQTGAAALSTGSGIASNIIGAGNAAAAGRVGAANAMAGGFGGAASSYNSMSLLRDILGNRGGGSNYRAVYSPDPFSWSNATFDV